MQTTFEQPQENPIGARLEKILSDVAGRIMNAEHEDERPAMIQGLRETWQRLGNEARFLRTLRS